MHYQKLEIKDFRLFHNKTIILGKYLTVLSGRNSTGKSTILGMIANSGEFKKKEGTTYSSRAFRAEFSELFKGSEKFDETGADKFKITMCDENGEEVDYRSFRTAWQVKNKRPRAKAMGNGQSTNTEVKQEKRFRVIPFKKLENGKKTEAKFDYPVLYLGLSRLFPIGESQSGNIYTKSVAFKNEEHKKWFAEKYERILSMRDDLTEITNYSIGETDKKSGVGVNTPQYDYLTNSSGQDNLGQILLALLSFKKLKTELGEHWRGGILLIDEVDATLHPAAQNRLLALFLEVARETGIQIVVTTHSLSLLKSVCTKITHNIDDRYLEHTIELYYFTQANRKLEIKRNISYAEIENDLLISSVIQGNNRVKLYTEDAEARWFLLHLLGNSQTYFKILDTTIGCDQLISLYNADTEYFRDIIIVFDGDVKKKQLDKIPPQTRKYWGNILLLPGGKRPEEVIYDYIESLDADHLFWSDTAQSWGFTWDYFHDHGPSSDEYNNCKARERYKKWFKNHGSVLESTHLMDFWMDEHSGEVKAFIEDLRKAYNQLAQRMMIPIWD